MRRRVLAVLALALLPGPAREASASCVCAPPLPPAESFAYARAVFVGRVLAPRPEEPAVSADSARVRFSVEEAWSGVQGRSEVEAGKGWCLGLEPMPGETYVVYAIGEDLQSLSIGCARVVPLAGAAEDLAFLDGLPAPGTGVRLHGTVAEVWPDAWEGGRLRVVGPVAGVPVTVEGAERRLDLVTDAGGRYQAAGLPPGRYRIAITPPSGYLLEGDRVRTSVEIDVWDDRAAVRQGFHLRPEGRVRGRVLDSQGLPAAGKRVFLLPDGRATVIDHDLSGVADAGGRYEIAGVPPGRYLLVFQPNRPPTAEEPCPTTYHPGVADRAGAAVLDLGRGQALDGIDLRLPPPLGRRPLRGVVVFEDGSPAPGAAVYLRDVGAPWEPTGFSAGYGMTTPEGTFALEGVDGRVYRLQANAAPDAQCPRPGRWWQSAPRQVSFVASEDPEDAAALRLVLACTPYSDADWQEARTRAAARAEQAVLVHRKLSDGSFGTFAEREALLDVAAKLEQLLAGNPAGEYGGHDCENGTLVLRFYGPDAGRLFDVLAPLLREIAPSGTRVVQRFGGRGAEEREVSLRPRRRP